MRCTTLADSSTALWSEECDSQWMKTAIWEHEANIWRLSGSNETERCLLHTQLSTLLSDLRQALPLGYEVSYSTIKTDRDGLSIWPPEIWTHRYYAIFVLYISDHKEPGRHRWTIQGRKGWMQHLHVSAIIQQTVLQQVRYEPSCNRYRIN